MVVLRNYGWSARDKKIRSVFSKFELKKLVLKSLLSSAAYPIFFKFYFSKLFYMTPKNSSVSRYKTFCLFSLYGRVIFKKFKLSRHFSKRFASHGLLLGFRKSSF